MKIAVTMGDPAGIGPDIVTVLMVALAEEGRDEQLIIIGDHDVLCERGEMLGVNTSVKLREIASMQDIPARRTPMLLDIPAHAPVVAGTADPRNARHVLAQIDAGIAGCRDGVFDALVTGPVNKAVINEAGVAFSGHTEYLADACGCDTVMMLICDEMRVALATTHLPLSAVPRALTRERLERTLRIVHADMHRLFGIAEPRIAVCGLNPHAGEGGYLGDEEEQVIRPVIAQLAATMNLAGPLPADTAFTPRQLSECDVVVAMYHDQGLPVIKHADFESAVNVTLGLPFVRTSVDHGTALELAGSGDASADSLSAAFVQAALLARARAAYQGRG